MRSRTWSPRSSAPRTIGAYIESAAGITEGGRTGFTALVVAGLFLLSLFFSPVLTAVPPHAYGTALVVTGIFTLSPLAKIDFSDYTELVPAFLTIVLMVFTFNSGNDAGTSSSHEGKSEKIDQEVKGIIIS
jgi:xanthine/uracil/vitamin C permease (AzgA family)